MISSWLVGVCGYKASTAPRITIAHRSFVCFQLFLSELQNSKPKRTTKHSMFYRGQRTTSPPPTPSGSLNPGKTAAGCQGSNKSHKGPSLTVKELIADDRTTHRTRGSNTLHLLTLRSQAGGGGPRGAIERRAAQRTGWIELVTNMTPGVSWVRAASNPRMKQGQLKFAHGGSQVCCTSIHFQVSVLQITACAIDGRRSRDYRITKAI